LLEEQSSSLLSMIAPFPPFQEMATNVSILTC
jgi:hypothetical protein